MNSQSNELYQFPEVRVVEASAGSGKTFALAKRYVQLLINPNIPQENIPIRHILAITFTNKASFEMKERILEFLKKIALKRLKAEEEHDILAPIGLTQQQASRKAFSVMNEIIYHYNFFQVQTIDSFINALLSGCAFKIGLSANFRIKRNYVDYLEYSLDQLIKKASEDKETFKIFQHFLHQYLYQENKPGWFPKKDMLALLVALYQKRNAYGHEFKSTSVHSEDIIKCKQKILKSIEKLHASYPLGIDKRFTNSVSQFLDNNRKGFDIDKISNYFHRDNIPLKKGAKCPASINKLWKTIRGQLKDLSEAEATSLFNPYVNVFNLVNDGFHKKAALDDVLFLEELNKKARNLFEHSIPIAELYYRLATRFHHYLIDEFQDTNPLQWQNLQPMVEEALSSGGSLFYVGDKKQAIYGFRGGEVKLFDSLQENYQNFNIQHERLERNYRSQKSIVDFINHIFSLKNIDSFIVKKNEYEAQKRKSDVQCFEAHHREKIENVFGQSHQQFDPTKNKGYVKVEFISEENKDKRDDGIKQKCLALIKKLIKRYKYNQIAILTRSNTEVEQVTSWLLEDGIFAESERTLNIQENSLIVELLAFLRFLNSPIDNMSFAQFILGDIYTSLSGVPKEDILTFLFEFRKSHLNEKGFVLYKEFKNRYPRQWDDFFSEFFKNVGLYPLYELVISIVHRLKVLSNFHDQQGFTMKFLEVLKEMEEESSDLTTFIEKFEALDDESVFVNVSDNNAIKVLTVHKAKGLEFPVCIIPFLGMDIHVGSGRNLAQQSFLADVKENHLELLRIKSKYLHFSENLSAIYQEEYVKSFLSEMNNIYVALTRAENELYAFVPKKTGNKFNLVNFLISEDYCEVGKVDTKMAAKEKSVERYKLPLSEYHNWIEYLQSEFTSQSDLINRRQILKGQIYHVLLSFIGNCHNQSLDGILDSAVGQAKSFFPNIIDFREFKQELEKFIESPQSRRFFYVEEGQVFNEKEVVNAYGHTKRIDRLVLHNDEVWIIDFKLRRGDGQQYESQVRNYMEILSSVYQDKKVSGFLLYLLDNQCQEVSEELCQKS